MPLDHVTLLHVALDFGETKRPVGRLAWRDGTVYFEYDADFRKQGLALSPLKLPLRPGLHSFPPRELGGLPGVFNDSMPDGWGKLLQNRALEAEGVLPSELTALDRLAMVGTRGLGALTYEPDHSAAAAHGLVDLDWLNEKSQEVLADVPSDMLEELIRLNGASGGARPKALLSWDEKAGTLSSDHDAGEPWLVKFANSTDGPEAGAIEYIYSLMARDAGLEMAPCKLFPSDRGPGYFATKRFDRNGRRRLHMHSASGLLHVDFQRSLIGYDTLTALTQQLTRDIRQVEKLFRLAVFNVLAHNRDDHGKNFSFLMDETGQWRLAPAYDLTFSTGPQNYQTAPVMGESRAPGPSHLRALAEEIGFKAKRVDQIIDQTRSALDDWPKHAKTYGVRAARIKLIQGRIQAVAAA